MKQRKNKKKPAALKPDAETLHTTDPPDKMQGPVSTPMHELEKVFDTAEP
ncbi:hypothetical protein [Niabella aurantiaca]|nr:hypothetical protein [Niabella aurantiaca]